VASAEHHREFGPHFSRASEDLHPPKGAHHHVEDHQIVGLGIFGEQLQGALPVIGDGDPKARASQ
jgi:hypothetical protein